MTPQCTMNLTEVIRDLNRSNRSNRSNRPDLDFIIAKLRLKYDPEIKRLNQLLQEVTANKRVIIRRKG